ncbi:MAG: nucleotide pyrophosphohydrolase [Defluviitaleaceae bacterium]|nr:nucleotide pyrophosphohydrolase [Defluviitaleaceae bacterium]
MDKHDFNQFRQVVDTLHGEDGCPWDKEQTLTSLVPHFRNETQELLDAIESGDSANLCEELGDVLLHIATMAKLAEKDGSFTLDDVVDGISRKMIRRHPHVFGDQRELGMEEVLKQWDEIKKAEKTRGF